jgi:sulfate-transporting ATPase
LRREEKSQSARQRTLERELEWIRMSPKARQTKSKARISAYNQLLGQESESRREEMEIYLPPGPRLGGVVIDAVGVRKAYDDLLLYDDLTVSIPAGAIVGIIGANGAGKTTLFRMITGQEEPDAGTLTVGETVKLGYVDQSRDTLSDDARVWEEISGGGETMMLGSREINSRAYVSRFGFGGSEQQKTVGQLSGGARNRVHLAKVLTGGANVLLLDEPTNDLDVNTLRALEGALEEFAGSALIISHDRWFLDRVATHVLAFEGDSDVVWFEGGYSDYERDLKRRKGDAADRPHRITYRKLTR